MTRNPLSKKAVSLAPSGIRKFFDIVSEMEDAISLGVGEPDFDTPGRAREEGIYSLDRGRTFYTSNAGLKELKLEISRYLARTIQVDYDYNREVLVTVGGSEAIDLAFRAMLDPGDEVLIPQPSYVSYLPCAVLADGVPVTIPLQHENKGGAGSSYHPQDKNPGPPLSQQPHRRGHDPGGPGTHRAGCHGARPLCGLR